MGGLRWNKKYDIDTDIDNETLARTIKENDYDTNPKFNEHLATTEFGDRRNAGSISTQIARMRNAVNGDYFSADPSINMLSRTNELRQLLYSYGFALSHSNNIQLKNEDITIIHGNSYSDNLATSTTTPKIINTTSHKFISHKKEEPAPIVKRITIAEKITQLYYCDTLRDLPTTRKDPIIGMYENYVRKGGKYKHINLSWKQINMANDIYNELIVM